MATLEGKAWWLGYRPEQTSGPALLTLGAVGPNRLGRKRTACPSAQGPVLVKEGVSFPARGQPAHTRSTVCVHWDRLKVQPRSLTGRPRFVISLYCISHMLHFFTSWSEDASQQSNYASLSDTRFVAVSGTEPQSLRGVPVFSEEQTQTGSSTDS